MHGSTFNSSLALVLCALLAGQSGPVGATECYVCDDLVVLDRAAANCFLEGFDTLSEQLSQEDGSRVEFDTGSCVDPDEERPRGGLSLMPTIGGVAKAATETKTRYTLDSRTASCLKELLETYEGSFDPDAKFDLAEDCNR